MPYPTCSYNMARFTFANGHVAVTMHNHVLQWYNKSLEVYARFWGLDMRQVTTIVYGSPWELAFAKAVFGAGSAGTTYNMVPDASAHDFYVDRFVEDVIKFGRGAGFAGNVVLTNWFSSDEWAPAVTAAKQMKTIAESYGISATLVLAFDVIKEKLANDWCGPSEECTNYSLAAGHQCIPSTPDVISWEILKHLRSSR
mmetsp:Transcript_9223/g.16001  ORF Transcript_9223/g.16001 Transcript_9223/m.16001 type:complete len:198 (+) Transcript_9223:1-594(+)